MNGKFILLVMLCLNITAFAVSYGCAQSADTTCAIGSNYMIDLFVDNESVSYSVAPNATGFGVDESFRTAIEDSTKESTGIISGIVNGIATFLDGLKMILGVLSLLTPFPILAFVFSVGLPFWATLVLGLPIFVLYTLSIIEAIGGRTF